MNRQQAEHILDAYVRLRMQGGDEEAASALREVVIDAMTSYRVVPVTAPNISDNTGWPYNQKTIVTC